MGLATALSLLAANAAYMLGAIGSDGTVHSLRVKTYEGQQVCTIKVTDAGDHGALSAGGCKAMGTFASAVRVEGTHAEQRYLDAAGNQVASGKEREDGFWIYTPDGKRYQLVWA